MINHYLNISSKTYELINKFKYSNIKFENKSELIENIYRLTEYEYLYFINEILLHINLDIETLKIIFSISYLNEDDVLSDEEAEKMGVIEYISYRVFIICREDILETHYLNNDIKSRLYQLFYLKNVYKQKLKKLDNEIIKKLQLIKTKKNLTILSNEFVESFPLDESNLDLGFDHLYMEKPRCFFEKTIENIKAIRFDYDSLNFWIDRKLKNELKSISKLIDLNDFKNHLYIYLISGEHKWKECVANNLLQSKSDFIFKKEFFIESINEFERRSNKNYITQILNKPNAIKRKDYFEHSIDSIYLLQMKDWITETFKTFQKMEDITLLKLIQNLPTNNKIILSPEFSQSSLLKILITFFESINVDLEAECRIDNLQGLVTNFTEFNEKVHFKKYVDKLPYSEIDFIPKKHFKNFIKIFLLLNHPKNNLIVSDITYLRKTLEALFYNKEKQIGLSYETIRKIDDLKLSSDIEKFKDHLRKVLSYSIRDYYLP